MLVATYEKNTENYSLTDICITKYTLRYNNTMQYNYKPTDKLFIMDNYLVIVETEWMNNLVVLSISDKHKYNIITDIKNICNKLLTMVDHVLIQNSPKWISVIKRFGLDYKQISDNAVLIVERGE